MLPPPPPAAFNAYEAVIAYEDVPNKDPVIPPKAFNAPLTVKLPVTNSTLLVTVWTYRFTTVIADAVICPKVTLFELVNATEPPLLN